MVCAVLCCRRGCCDYFRCGVMTERKKVYFASDVHLGLDVNDPADRERRFVSFLRSIPVSETVALYLLGDIWDFWYEYRDVVPKGYVRVFSAFTDLVDAGVKLFFFTGNHDIWAYKYFESLGITVVRHPLVVEHGGVKFCLAHGDGLGPGMRGYKLMNRVFKCHAAQSLFSLLHPWIAFRLGYGWSRSSRLSRGEEYVFKGESEPLYQWAESFAREHDVDCFVFGHLHTSVDRLLPGGERFIVLKDWINSSPYLYFDGTSVLGGMVMNME